MKNNTNTTEEAATHVLYYKAGVVQSNPRPIRYGSEEFLEAWVVVNRVNPNDVELYARVEV